MPSFEGRELACQRGERLLFHHLDFTLDEGEALILVGANGSGKSSLLRLAAGLSRPAAGALIWDGREITRDLDLHHRRVIYLGHADGLKAGLTVRENVKFWSDLDGARGSLDEALQTFDLTPLADLPARFLSAGQRRRATLARLALDRSQPAQIWLLDEPTTALDRDGQAVLSSLIQRHRSAGGRVMLASHDPLPELLGRRLRVDDHLAAVA
ncbi:heme ABC exporter ATP-binding protein CcmA [Dongia soli]|uniref:Heme ABC exporter ATP-binding protein CcmA n=1 Tax=Dongia soli TaxID=600628 RepID=A0ABU5E6D9_9PROT|nr:heme ABC exporter ATP-binding protein CcmA [Dongia soli]MDY0881882.1 heme ABC exporter ATP-binding protein CcmA [Dongia soli]